MGSFEQFRVVVTRPDRVRLVGELDLAGLPELRACLARLTGDVEVEVDCSGLSFIDASALGVLLGAHNACEERGAKIILVDPAACVTRLLALTGLDVVFHTRYDGLA